MIKTKCRKKVLNKINSINYKNIRKREVTFFTKDSNKNIKVYSVVAKFRRKSELSKALSKLNFNNKEEKFYLILDLKKVA